jgi:hypothetical protein
MREIKNIFFTILTFIFININSKLSAQTWINTFEYENTWGTISLRRDTANVGPYNMIRSSDGNIIMLSQVNQAEKGTLIKINPFGNRIWATPAYLSGGIQFEDAYSLRATNDSGCVYLFRHQGASIISEVRRINSNGSTKWIKQYSLPEIVDDVVQTNYNTTLVVFQDSLEELNSSGNRIRSRLSPNSSYFVIGDSDLIVTNASGTRRENFSGTNIKWSIPNAYYPIYADTNIIYANDIVKLQSSTGNVIWNVIHDATQVAITSDLGLITMKDKTISRLDSSGNIIWQRIVDFPAIRLTGIMEANPNQYITGGQYKCMNAAYYGLTNVGYAAFYASLDSSGHGVIDSLDSFFMGNANDNSIGGFVDDAAYIAVASGRTGTPRIPAVQFSTVSAPFSVFGTDWDTSFYTGVNYKYSDVNGDGLIDLADIDQLSHFYYWNYQVSPHWRLSSFATPSSSTAPILKLVCENDSLFPGDSSTINIILGSSSATIDSIYALAATINTNFFESMVVDLTAQQFGYPGVSLYQHFYSTNSTSHFLIARNDHQNAIIAGDTIAKIRFHISPTAWTGIKIVSCTATALTALGYPVTLNIEGDSLYISSTTGINKIPDESIIIFPNPTSNYIHINAGNEKILSFKLIDNYGRVLKCKNDIKTNGVEILDLSIGIYYVQIFTENGEWNSKIFINR